MAHRILLEMQKQQIKVVKSTRNEQTAAEIKWPTHNSLNEGIKNQRTDESMNRWLTCEPLESMNQKMDPWINESVKQLTNESANPWLNKAINEGIAWIKKSMNQWINQSMNQWITESNQSINQSTNQSINQWIRESMNPWT